MTEDDGPPVGDVIVKAGAAIAHLGALGGHPIVMHGIEWFIDGYREALARFRAASERNDRSPEEIFKPLFEALNWAASAEEGLRVRMGEDTSGAPVRGLRFARNRVHHQWVDAIQVKEIPVEASAGPLTISGLTFDWFWKPVTNLPAADRKDADGEAAYVSHLAERPVRETLFAVEAFFAARTREA